LVVVVTDDPRLASVMVTVAFGTTAPLGSVTKPVKVPEVACAIAAGLQTTDKNRTAIVNSISEMQLRLRRMGFAATTPCVMVPPALKIKSRVRGFVE
jgi:hypothetical protein